ncbi:hypothetical protein ONS95_003094 [Cadophora gregata]|uniref:uncharacterized protein n=1 Tax=Cadophora gregata TaxID=51156 RepID=UPI0026DD2371|nr:uncharacterized protein ONS95_003094 [Cadophora gregata]KAK0108277.1 hypothetical protein ONS95_003094 [Cadophora gregata]
MDGGMHVSASGVGGNSPTSLPAKETKSKSVFSHFGVPAYMQSINHTNTNKEQNKRTDTKLHINTSSPWMHGSTGYLFSTLVVMRAWVLFLLRGLLVLICFTVVRYAGVLGGGVK